MVQGWGPQRSLKPPLALAAQAADTGLLDVEVRARLGLAYTLARISAQQCLDVVEWALRLSTRQHDPLLRARTRMRCYFLRLWAGGGNAQGGGGWVKVFAED